MKNKILLSLLFVIAFFVILSASDKVSAGTFTYDNKTFEFPEDKLMDYTIIQFWSFNESDGNYVFSVTTRTKPLIYMYNEISGVYSLFNQIGDIDDNGYFIYDENCNYIQTNFLDGSRNIPLDKQYSVLSVDRFKEGDARPVVYCNFDICDVDGNIVFNSINDKVDLNLTVTPNTDTKNVPIKISTDFYSLKVFEDILVQYSTNQEDWETCKWGRITDGNSSNNGKYNFYLDVYRNGTYYFRLWNAADNTYIYKTVIISNIVYSPDDVNNYVNGVFDPTPFLTYEYINDNKINIITQKFFIDQIIDLQCFYAKDISKEDYNNKQKWTKVEARTMIDQLTQRDVYQFCFEVDNGSFNADGTYTVCFYNVFLDKYTYSEIVIDFDEILKVDGSMIWKYVHFFKERFGFLIYPFDLTINTLKRIASIDYGEPKFNIPDIYEPTTNKKLISAVTFNFNDYLENNTFKTVHNTYLIIVDAVIIFGLLNLAWKKISGVFK